MSQLNRKMKTTVLALLSVLMASTCSAQDPSITQMVRFTVNPESIEEFRQAQVNSLNNSLKEDGNLGMQLYADDKRPNEFYVYSKWKEEEAYRLHVELPHSKALAPLFKQALQSAPEIIRLRDLEFGRVESKAVKPTGEEQTLLIPLKVKPEYRDRIIKQLEKHAASARKDDGNLAFEFYAVEGQENTFYVRESWKTVSAMLENHATQSYAKATKALLDEALIGKLEDVVVTANPYDETTLTEEYSLEKLW